MTILKQVVVLGFFLFLFAGCNEYTAQLCTSANMIDVPGITGNRMAVSYDATNRKVIQQPLSIQRVGVGSYTVNGGALSTCKSGNLVLAEVANAAHSTFSSYVLTVGQSYFDLVVASLDKVELDAAGIPNKVVKYPNNDEVLVTDNSHVDSSVFLRMFHATSFVFRVY